MPLNNYFLPTLLEEIVVVLRDVAAQAFWWGEVADSVGWPTRL